MIRTILFDLDGTLACMDQNEFIRQYYQTLGQSAASQGISDPKKLLDAVTMGTYAMMQNDGTMSNEERFWKVFPQAYGEGWQEAVPLLDHFYTHEFKDIQSITTSCAVSRKLLSSLRRKGYTIALATSPVFPRVATEERIRWASLQPEDFDYITTYENSHYAKPSREYYREVLTAVGALPEECLMIGNDADEDMCTAEWGFSVYLVIDHLLNRSGGDISGYPQGTLKKLAEYLASLPDLRHAYTRMAHYYETDSMGIVHHSNYVRWLEEARVDWMDAVGFGYDAMEQAGISSPVLAVQCEYKSPVHFHDTVRIYVRLTEFTGVRLHVSYEIVDADSGELRLLGETSHCFTDRSGRPISLKKACPEAYALYQKQVL